MQPLKGRAVESAIIGIHSLLLTGAVIAALSIGRDICIPIAVAALLTFLLAPVVTRMERWLGRITAVLLMVLVVSSGTVVLGYVVARQIVDLTMKLPDYQVNIQQKLRAFQVGSDSAFSRVTRSIEELREDFPGGTAASAGQPTGQAAAALPVAVRVVEPTPGLGDNAQTIAGPVLGAVAQVGLIFLLTVFMLMKREDLRGRLISLIGRGRISATTHAMADAGSRVHRYLAMQLVVNVIYGIPVAAGLYLIGVPNAMLWGAMAIVLRFIPYVGPWVAAAVPVALSLAVSDGWTMPLMTIGLFVLLELVSNNVMEPWLYGTSTGVSPLALILAAVFWAWMWGPVGLVVATPLTVCLVVMGRHVRRLQFLSILLSDDEPLAPHQECYHRLLRADLGEATALVDGFLKTRPLAALYDEVLIPVLASAETDHGRDDLDNDQRAALHQGVRDILDELFDRPAAVAAAAIAAAAEPGPEHELPGAAAPTPACRVLCVPVRALRDELAGDMLAHVLRKRGIAADALSARLTTGDLVEQIVERAPHAVCISVVAPSAVVHARHLCAKLHARLPRLVVVVGLWGSTDGTAAAAQALGASGADGVVVTLAEAIERIDRVAAGLAPGAPAAPDTIGGAPSPSAAPLVEPRLAISTP